MDPSIYLMNDENKLSSALDKKDQEACPASVASDDNNPRQEKNSLSDPGNHSEVSISSEQVCLDEEISANEIKKVSGYLETIDLAGSVSQNKGSLPLKILVMSVQAMFYFVWKFLCHDHKGVSTEEVNTAHMILVITLSSCR